MARVLIANFDDGATSELVRLFRLRGHDTDGRSCAGAIAGKSSGFEEYDLIVVDVSRTQGIVETIFGKLRASRSLRSSGQVLLCVSCIYRGPEWEFNLSEKGACVVYVEPSAGAL